MCKREIVGAREFVEERGFVEAVSWYPYTLARVSVECLIGSPTVLRRFAQSGVAEYNPKYGVPFSEELGTKIAVGRAQCKLAKKLLQCGGVGERD